MSKGSFATLDSDSESEEMNSPSRIKKCIVKLAPVAGSYNTDVLIILGEFASKWVTKKRHLHLACHKQNCHAYEYHFVVMNSINMLTNFIKYL